MDGYNKDIKLDFERQGKQHYKFHEYFFKNETFGSFSKDMVRISYETAIDKIKEAMDRIEEYIKEL